MPKPEPFGYFRAEPFGWTDCAETDEGAMALYDQAAVDALERERDELALIIATDTGTESAVADLQRQLVAVTAERDELKDAIELYEQALMASWPEGAMGDAFEYWNAARAAIAKGEKQA